MRFGTDSVIGEKLDHVRGISRKTREIGDARGRQDNSDLAPSPSKSGIAVGISADFTCPRWRIGGSYRHGDRHERQCRGMECHRKRLLRFSMRQDDVTCTLLRVLCPPRLW